ncbi:hypothetical protein EBZ80_10530 [bacterium]|nr:hypothetical protein [bacterium]
MKIFALWNAAANKAATSGSLSVPSPLTHPPPLQFDWCECSFEIKSKNGNSFRTFFGQKDQHNPSPA